MTYLFAKHNPVVEKMSIAIILFCIATVVLQFTEGRRNSFLGNLTEIGPENTITADDRFVSTEDEQTTTNHSDVSSASNSCCAEQFVDDSADPVEQSAEESTENSDANTENSNTIIANSAGNLNDSTCCSPCVIVTTLITTVGAVVGAYFAIDGCTKDPAPSSGSEDRTSKKNLAAVAKKDDLAPSTRKTEKLAPSTGRNEKLAPSSGKNPTHLFRTSPVAGETCAARKERVLGDMQRELKIRDPVEYFTFTERLYPNADERWHCIGEIGKGSFGTILQLEYINKNDLRTDCDPIYVAMKVIKLQGNNPFNVFPHADLEKFAMLEKDCMPLSENLDHPNIAKVYGCTKIDLKIEPYSRYARELFKNPNVSFIQRIEATMVMEYCAGGNFREFLWEDKNRCALVSPIKHLKIQTIKSLMKQLLSAVKYMHEKKIVHRDLKPENIVLEKPDGTDDSDESKIVLKVIDFGVSAKFNPEVNNGKLTEGIGSLSWMAPEILRGRYDPLGEQSIQYDKRVDIYSLGVLLETLLSEQYIQFFKFPDFVVNKLDADGKIISDGLSSDELNKVAVAIDAYTEIQLLNAFGYKDKYSPHWPDVHGYINHLDMPQRNSDLKRHLPEEYNGLETMKNMMLIDEERPSTFVDLAGGIQINTRPTAMELLALKHWD